VEFTADTIMTVLVFATLAVASSWLGAYARIVTFGQAVFFGIGGYAVAVSNLRGGSPWYGALGGALVAVIVAVACGLLFLRGRGVTFTFVTLVLGVTAEPFVTAKSPLGRGGIFAFPYRPGFLNLQFDEKWPYVLLALAVFAVAVGLTFALRSTRPGYCLHAVRTNLAAARSVGIDALPPRLLVLVASAFVTSVAGSLFAEYARGVAPHALLAFGLGADVALVGIVAGPRSPWGAPAAGALLALLYRALPPHAGGAADAVVIGVEMVAVMLVAVLRPAGLIGDGAPRPARTAWGGAA
jgi:branched-chain amino acid transport system permease protein